VNLRPLNARLFFERQARLRHGQPGEIESGESDLAE
jgi:hypothetical protein